MKKSSREYVSTLGTGLRLNIGSKEEDRIHLEIERRKLDKSTGEITKEFNTRMVRTEDLPRILQCYEEVK